jgi:hypothetical protein
MAIYAVGYVSATAVLVCGMKYCGMMPDHMSWFKALSASVIFGTILGLLFSVLHFEAACRKSGRQSVTAGGWVLLWAGGSLALLCLGLFAIGIIFDRHEYLSYMVFGWLFIVACGAAVMRPPSGPRP